MTIEELEDREHQELLHVRKKRVKRLLKYMPRRATLHRYPFLKYFAKDARKCSYLWSFRSSEVVPAIYAGCVLTFMPLVGIQTPIALGLAFLFRSNLMILVGLQFISNVFTVPPIYAADLYVGSTITSLFGSSSAVSNIDSFGADQGISFGSQGLWAIRVFIEMMLGGVVIGSIVGAIAVALYKIFAARYHLRVRKKAR